TGVQTCALPISAAASSQSSVASRRPLPETVKVCVIHERAFASVVPLNAVCSLGSESAWTEGEETSGVRWAGSAPPQARSTQVLSSAKQVRAVNGEESDIDDSLVRW